MSETRESTRWTCEKCGRSAVVVYASDAGVYDVLDMLRDSHRATSPECAMDLGSVRVERVPSPEADRDG